MGGFSSGRKAEKNCTEDYLWIDIRRWQREGVLILGRYFNWQWIDNGEIFATIGVKVGIGQLGLSYNYRKNEDDWESLDYTLLIHNTPCHFGSERYWFNCPAVGCGRRVAILYLADKYFACRHCYRLTYQSQRQDQTDRLIRKGSQIREKLKWTPGITNPEGPKPKGMHWKTFRRLQNMQNHYTIEALVGTIKKLKSNFLFSEEY